MGAVRRSPKTTQKAKLESPWDPAISPAGTGSRIQRKTHTPGHSNPNGDVSTHKRRDQQNVVSAHDGVVRSHGEGRASAADGPENSVLREMRRDRNYDSTQITGA